MSPGAFTTFTNCRYCLNGRLVHDRLVVSQDKGTLLTSAGSIGGQIVDLGGAIVAPGFLELQTNGVNGFHFTHFDTAERYSHKLGQTARYYATQGVTGFWATIPTVAPHQFQEILPCLAPREFPESAALLGAHTEGPFLAPAKKGAHNASLFVEPSTSPANVYGDCISKSIIKLATIAPELSGSENLVRELTSHGVKVSLGHSNATLQQGQAALEAGATALTHTLNAMSPLMSREPGLAGLITAPIVTASFQKPYYSLIPDGHHLHPNIVALLYRANPEKAILITDSIKVSGLPDGVYPGHAQIPHSQQKRGNLVTIEGTDTLIGGCISLQEGARNLIKWTGCSTAEAVRTVTENVAGLMGIDGEGGRGVLLEGRRADLCVLSEDGEVLQTWIAGRKVWDKETTAQVP